jgi:nickel-dependent lactate racemase
VQAKAYFKGKPVIFELPSGWKLVAVTEPKEVKPIIDIEAALNSALSNPIGLQPLSKLTTKLRDERVVIVSEDQTRPSPTGQVILPLLNKLNSLGISDDRVDIVIALGTHRRMDRHELERKLGGELLQRVNVTQHDADESADLVKIGVTRRGTPCLLNRTVAEAGLKIGIGTVIPHYFAGFGGGPKIILPGISGRETIRINHVLVGDPASEEGKLDGNPVWEDMLEAARLARLDLKIDLLLNMAMQIHRIFAGEVEAAQKAAVKAFLGIYGAPMPRYADLTITSSYPLESNLVQSSKAILSAERVTKEGGTIFLISACSEGIGPSIYEALQEKPTPEQVVRWIGEGKIGPSGGPIASRLRRILQTKRLMIVAEGLIEEQLQDMGIEYASSIEDALKLLSHRYARADVISLPFGGLSYPFMQSQQLGLA